VFFGIGALTMSSAIASLSRVYSVDQIVAGIGGLALLPAAYCLAISFPPPKLNAERFSALKSLRLLGDPLLLVACLAMAFQSGMEGMSNDWMTRYFKNVTLAGIADSERSAQIGLVALTGAMVATRFLLAGLLQRVGSRTVLLASVVITLLGAITLMIAPTYGVAVIAAGLIGVGLAAVFPVVLGFVGDRYPEQSGTAFSTIFVVALAGNMAINKTFGYIAQEYGVQQYPNVMLVLLGSAAVLLYMVCSMLTSRPNREPR
jgi:MFS transporter, FHS family, glucose/mannose:H+ symporter